MADNEHCEPDMEVVEPGYFIKEHICGVTVDVFCVGMYEKGSFAEIFHKIQVDLAMKVIIDTEHELGADITNFQAERIAVKAINEEVKLSINAADGNNIDDSVTDDVGN